MAAYVRNAASPVPQNEVFGKTVNFEGLSSPTISYGLPFDEAVPRHIAADARVYVIVSKTLSLTTDSFERLKRALGTRLVGTRVGMTPHTMYQECLEVSSEAKSLHADTIMTLGAGSLADAAKFVCASFTNDLSTIEALKKFDIKFENGKIQVPANKPSTARLVFIPTSLSGGEHNLAAGITDRDDNHKYQITAARASVTILDPWLCASTPSSIWLQSGVRGIDHCVENACYLQTTWPQIPGMAAAALKLLIPGLIEYKRTLPHVRPEALLNAQVGVALAIVPLSWGCSAGASHGIGHMLGPMGRIGHGETSCILLPAVCKYNAAEKHNVQRQSVIRDALWEIPVCREIFARDGLEEANADLGDLLDVVIRELGMPRTLREKGFVGEERLRALARMSLNDFFLQSNPRPIDKENQVMEILSMVKG